MVWCAAALFGAAADGMREGRGMPSVFVSNL